MTKHMFMILVLSWVIPASVNAESIELGDYEHFQLSSLTTHRVKAKAFLPKMPTALKDVVPDDAPKLTSKGYNPPGGIIPIAIDPSTQRPVILLAHEYGNVKGFSDFGGSGDPTDNSREHTAVREFNEETCLAFWEDLTSQPLLRDKLTGSELEEQAKQPLTENVIPWFYAKTNKYFTCVLPVRYQQIDDLAEKVNIVRKKVSSSPFFEKRQFVWIPLEQFIEWIENDIQNPVIPNGDGKPMSWRFFGGRLKIFTDLQNSPKLGWLYDRVINYLKEIITLNS